LWKFNVFKNSTIKSCLINVIGLLRVLMARVRLITAQVRCIEYPHIADETLRIGIGLDSVSTGVIISVKVGLKQAKCFLQFEEDLIQSVQFDRRLQKSRKIAMRLDSR